MTKNTYVYPGSDLDRSRTLVALLGTFWSRTYTGVDQVRSYTDATAHTVNQTYQNLLRTVHAISRHEIPLFHEEQLIPIVIRKSDLNSARTNLIRFDTRGQRFAGAGEFDSPEAGSFFSFPAPDNLHDVAQIFDRITYPKVVLSNGVDFIVDTVRGALTFAQNPFDNSGLTHRAIQTGGQSDEEITLWGFRAQYDYEYVFTQFAYALGIRLKTSQGYKDFINALFDALVAGGLTAAGLDTALSALCGIPVVVENEETVEVVEYDAFHLLIATDKNIYKFPETATPNVSVGDLVRAGDRLVRGFEIDEFFVTNSYLNDEDASPRPETNDSLVTDTYEAITTEAGENFLNVTDSNCPPPRKQLTLLALDNSFLATCFYGDLTFENKSVPLIVDTKHPSGYTYVKFEVNGYPGDTDRFFDDLHARGIALANVADQPCFQDPIDYDSDLDLPKQGESGKIYRTLDSSRYYDWVMDDAGGRYEEIIKLPPKKRIGTLAHLLDKRRQPDGEPGPDNLPKFINPLKFLVENVLRNNVFVVRIQVAALGQNRLGLYNIRHLRQVLPPQTAMIVVFDLNVPRDRIRGDRSLTSEITFFTGAEPQADVVDENYVKDLSVTLTQLSGTCQ